VSFIRYLDDLYESGAVEQTHIVGDDQQLFETTASLPVVRHDTETESPAAVLDDAVALGSASGADGQHSHGVHGGDGQGNREPSRDRQ